jgi:hypothetical protein
MNARRLLAWLVIPVVLAGGDALGQSPPEPTIATAAGDSPAASAEAGEIQWLFSAFAYAYLVPDDDDYLQPTVTADRGWLHLEARYNYEDFSTGSLWLGYNLSGGEELAVEFTPMIAAVAGDTDGVAPGYRLSLSYWKLELSTEGEYVFDAGDSADNFFYSWSELSIWPLDWLGVGVVVQRTRLRDSDSWAEPGILVSVAYRQASLTAYVFDSDEGDPTVVVGAGLSF